MAIEGEGASDGFGSAADLLGDAAGGGGTGGGGGGDGGAGGGSGDGGAGGGENGGGEGGGFTAPDWFEKVSAQAGEGETSSNRDWLTAKGVKDIDGLAKIARDTERALRDNGRVKVPGEGAKPEEITAFRTAIGVPDKVDGYEIKGPEGIKLNEPLINSLRESALKHGAPKGAFEGLVGDFIQSQLDEAAATKKAQDDGINDWKSAQGAKLNEQTAHIEAAARGLGLSSEEMSWFRTMPTGAGRALDLLSKLGSGMAEDVLVTGGKGRFGVSGAEAKTQMDQMKADPDISAKIMKPGTPERARWDLLNASYSEYEAARRDKEG